MIMAGRIFTIWPWRPSRRRQSLFFGVAHLHHLHKQYKRVPPAQRSMAILRQILLRVMVQWTYTTLFGACVSHVFVRTGSLGAVTMAHIICNYWDSRRSASLTQRQTYG